jgi:hypothetical protein
MEDSSTSVKYTGTIPAAGIFNLNDRLIRVILSSELLRQWGISNENAALQEIGPLWVWARAGRGIIGPEYYLTPDIFKKIGTDEIMSYKESVEFLKSAD